MSYRSRLSLFFGLIVLVPMAAVTVLVVQLSSESRTGKADARLAGGLQTALTVYRDEQEANRRTGRAIVRDRSLAQALAGGRPEEVQAAVDRISRERKLRRLSITDARDLPLAEFVSGVAVAPVELTLQGPRGRLGSIVVSGIDGREYLEEVRRLTGAEVILSNDVTRLLATEGAEAAPPDLGSGKVPASETVDLASGSKRARSVGLAPGQRLTLVGAISSGGLVASQPLLASVLVVFFIVALTLIVPLLRDLQELHDLVAQQAVTDELTGLSNQRRFRELMAKEVERARRFNRPLSLLMLDLDDFKEVNDKYGHLEGDHVLSQVAEVLRSESREIDEPARYGGEEFAVALPETTSEGAVELGERIRQRIESTPITLRHADGQNQIQVRASVGVAGTPETEADVTRLISAADSALYSAKRAGKNRTERAG